MAKRSLKVRKIIFGIRFKFSAIMIAGVIFVSALISVAVYNQHEKKIRDTMLRMGTTTLSGVSLEARQSLSYKHTLIDPMNKLAPFQRLQLNKLIKDANEKMTKYFAMVINKDKMLDVAYLIDSNWQDVDSDWKDRGQSLYYHFRKNSGTLFVTNNIGYGPGRKDPFLEPTVYSHFMNNIVTDTYITYIHKSDIQKEFREAYFKDKPHFVAVGIPLFNNPSDSSFYKSYLEFKELSITDKPFQLIYWNGIYSLQPVKEDKYTIREKVKAYNKLKNRYKSQFIQRIINGGMKIDYFVSISDSSLTKLPGYFIYNYKATTWQPAKMKEFYKAFSKKLKSSGKDGFISLSKIKATLKNLMKTFGMRRLTSVDEKKMWKNFYWYLIRNKIKVQPVHSIDELALISYRKDLAGILGLYLTRKYYSAEMQENRREIVNLIISILLRAIFVALLFPTFLIRKISYLSEGALEIGKGDLETKIEVRGSDELGRLADILNLMTKNLQKAQELKIEKIRMENELITAQSIQEALLPESLPNLEGFEFGAYYSAQTESGGDYYDFIVMENNMVGLTIADVSGHGVGSGLVMAMTRTLLHTYCDKTQSPKKIFEIINDYLKENTASNYFVTMFYGIIDRKNYKLTFSSAGHNPTIIMRKNKLIELPAGGIALGATSQTTFSKLTEIKGTQLQKGDYLFQYTDGVDEAMDSNSNEYGIERLHDALLKNYGKSPQELINGVANSITDFTGNIPQHDDITMIAIKIL